MMKNECNIIRDLLPLYAEKMVSGDTEAFVEEHLKGCEACRKEYETTKEPNPNREVSDTVPLLKLSRKIKIKKIQTIVLTAVFVIALLVSLFAVLDAPIYFPYTEGIVTAGQNGDKGMLLTFDQRVTDFDCEVYEDPDGGDFYYCDIQAWTSLWDKWFSGEKGTLSQTVTTRKTESVIAVYVPNDGSENVCIAKYNPNSENRIDNNVSYKNEIVLPRISLGYYLILAIIALAVLGIIWLLVRKKAELRVWTERIIFYPVAYIVSNCIVSGIKWTTYSLPRDFSLTVLISILLYGGLLLAHNILRLKREIKSINQ